MSFACLFPGQGSQSLQMMDNLKNVAEVRQLFDEARDILNLDLLRLLEDNNLDAINQTVNTQPLMLVAGYATYITWIKTTKKIPTVVTGHSLGEWTALVASHVLKFSDAVKLVGLRAEYMQNAVKASDSMMAVVLGLADDVVTNICKQVSQETQKIVAAVNFNSPGQVVIAGENAIYEIITEVLKKQGAKRVQLLPVSVPSHCILMKNAAEKLQQDMLNIQFNTPEISIIQNVDASIHRDIEVIRNNLIKQIYSPVLWSKSVKQIVDMGIKNMLECGPNKVLSGLNKRIDDSIQSFNINSMQDMINVNSLI